MSLDQVLNNNWNKHWNNEWRREDFSFLNTWSSKENKLHALP
jgi:hypothetical protein